ncbi:MAG: hypothetical protein Q4D79_09305 [Propionibacteriaceae bacterium]|nr:hypothetical protein [Propionibacteriaceae bacterium]
MGTPLFVTIAVMTVIVAVTAGLFARGRSLRTLLAGVGFTLLPLSLYLTGLTTLLANGIASLIAWVGRTSWDNTMAWGLGLGGLGIVLMIVAGFLPKREGQREPKSPKPAPAPKARSGLAGKATQDSPAANPQPKQASQQASLEDLDEIEAILKNRGIN